MTSAPTVGELLNAANWEYYQSVDQPPSDLRPLFNSDSIDPTWNVDGMNAEVFQTPSGALIVAFEGTNTDPSGSAYSAAFAAGSAAADNSILAGTNPTQITAVTDATSFMSSVAAYAATQNVATSNIYVTGHSLGAAVASWVSFADGYSGTAFATPGLAFAKTGMTGSGTFINYIAYGDAVGNLANNPPNAEGQLTEGLGQSHYGTTIYLGMATEQSAVLSFGTLLDGAYAAYNEGFPTAALDTAAEAAKLGLGTMPIYHSVANYASLLGVEVTNTTPAAAASQSGIVAAGGSVSFGGVALPNTAGTPYTASDVASVTALVGQLEGADPSSAIVDSIYDAMNSAKTDSGFLPAISGSNNIAFLDPALTQTTGSGSSAVTTSLDPSGVYTVPNGYQAMIATGDFSYQMMHQGGETAMKIVANAGLDTVVSAVSGDTVQAGTGYLVDVQRSGALTFLAGGNASSVFGGTGTTTYYGGAGNDLVLGGTGGGSALYAGSGSVTMVGGGSGSLFGGSGSDILMGGTSDLLVAGSGNTTLVSGISGNAYLGGGANTVFGASGGTITGGAGTGLAVLGAGTETFVAGAGEATVFGGIGLLDMMLGAGNDAVILGGSGTASVAASADSFIGHAVVFGFSSADQLSLSGYGSGQVTQTVYQGSTVVTAHGATITLVGYTEQVATS